MNDEPPSAKRETDRFAIVRDRLIGVWITSARFLTVAIGLVVVVYLVLRPFWPSSLPFPETQASYWSTMSHWPALLANTLLVSGLATCLSLGLGLPLSFLMFRTDLPGRRLLTGGLLLLACLPLFVTASAVMTLFGLRSTQGNAVMAGVIHGWVGAPVAILQLGLAYRCVDRALVEAAMCETSMRGVWRHIEWQQIRWCVVGVLLLQLWLAGTDVTVSDMLSVRTFAEEVYITFQLSGSAAMQSLVAAPYIALFGLLVMWVMRSMRSANLYSARVIENRPHLLSLRRFRWLFALIAVALFGVLVYLPLTALAVQIESFRDFVRLAKRLGEELSHSLLLAGFVTIVTLIITMGIFVVVSSANWKGRCVRYSLITLCALPSPALAIFLIECLNRPGPLGTFYDSPAALILGQTLKWLPPAVLLTLPALLRVPRHVIDAARTDGCDDAALHLRIYWPVALPFLAIAATVTTILVLGEVTVSVLLSPPGFLPLSVRFFTLVHYGLRNEAASICWLIVIVLLIPWSVLTYLLHRSDRSGS